MKKQSNRLSRTDQRKVVRSSTVEMGSCFVMKVKYSPNVGDEAFSRLIVASDFS